MQTGDWLAPLRAVVLENREPRTRRRGRTSTGAPSSVISRTETLEVRVQLVADFGDAPDLGPGTGPGDYETLSENGGPSHTIVPGLFLGASVDADNGVLQNIRANADDVDAALPDDENGVLNPLDLQTTFGSQPAITLLATNTTGSPATLSGWIDYNGDGIFDNATERTQTTVNGKTTDGRVTLTFPAIPDDTAGKTFARFRLSTDAVAQNETGAASDGEVEDYVVTITVPSSGTVDRFLKIADGTGGLGINTLASFDYFGNSVAGVGDLDGDGIADLAVGAYRDDTGGSGRGAVHVLFLNADGTVKTSTKIASNTAGGPTLADGDNFGSSVVNVGDLNGDGVIDLAVGATGDDTEGSGRGAVHVLFLDTDGTVKTSTKIASDTAGGPTLADGDGFGSSVAGVGDLDGNGVVDFAVGAHFDDTGSSSRGAVHVLMMKSNGTVKSSAKIASDTGGGPTLFTFARFGSSVSGIGDLDGDGIADLAVGARGSFSGAAYVLLMNSDGTAKASTTITNAATERPTLGTIDRFGTSVSGIGDLDGDGVPDLIVGAPGDDTGGYSRGVVHVFLLNPDGTVKTPRRIASGIGGGPALGDGDRFGSAVARAGDLDGDGAVDLIVGAPGDDTGGSFRGAVHVLFLLTGLEVPESQHENVTLSGGGSYEVLREESDLVLRNVDGTEAFRSVASLVESLTITGSIDADVVTVLDTRVNVDIPLVFAGGDGDDRFDASLASGSVTLTGGAGNDVLLGGSASDVLNGGSGKDQLVGGEGNDLIRGQGGTGDTLEGGDGDDTLNGGAGNDLIRETVLGDATLSNSAMTGRGSDLVFSVERATLIGSNQAQTIDVSAFFTAGLTSTMLDGRDGGDTLIGSLGSDGLIGAGGNDRLEGNSGRDRLFGGASADTLIGGLGNDLLKGQGASGDWLSGGEGDDSLYGGQGVDRLIEAGNVDFLLTNSSLTGIGSDQLRSIEIVELDGGPSDNVIDVSGFFGFKKGFTLIRGHGGNDFIIGSASRDVVHGGEGNDTLQGKAGNDHLDGNEGDDRLTGHDGDDFLKGSQNRDIMFGGGGNDTLNGSNAVDTLVGGNGNDSISGKGGIDLLVRGTGRNDPSAGDVINDPTARIDEAFNLDPMPEWVDQV